MDFETKLDHTLTQNHKKRGRGRVFFLRHLNTIRQALDAGHVRKDVWQTLHDEGQMPISYRQFNNLVVKLIEPGRLALETPPAEGFQKVTTYEPASTTTPSHQPRQLPPRQPHAAFEPKADISNLA